MIPVNELDTDKQARDIARRQRQEEDRKKRIFDAKWRTIGQDVNALQAQIEEKKRRLAEEKARERALEAEQLAADRKLIALEEENQRQREEARRELLEYYKTNQQRTMRREYDLTPEYDAANSLPARVCTSSSFFILLPLRRLVMMILV